MQSNSGLTFLSPKDARWMEFIRVCPDANIFHHPSWMELMQDCYGYTASILVLEEPNGEIRAGIPLMDVKSPLTGNHRVSLPFSDYCAPLFCTPEAREELADRLIDYFKRNPQQRMEIRWELPERNEIQRVSDFVLHTIKLEPDPADVARRFKRTHLQNIHTAEERGVKVEFGDKLEHLKVFYNLQLETRKRHGVPAQPWRYFEKLYEHIFKQGMGFTLLAKKDDQYIAGMVYLGWGSTLIAKYAASREDSFNLRPNNLLFWEGICHGCRNGFQVFDMGRTEMENEGLRNFKSRWGAVEQPLYYSIFSTRHVKTSNGKLEHILHSVIRHSPLWVCRLSGELLYKFAG